MTGVEWVATHLKTIGAQPSTSYVMRDASYEETGEYLVSCDVGLFVGEVTKNEHGTRVLAGGFTPWEEVDGVEVRIEG